MVLADSFVELEGLQHFKLLYNKLPGTPTTTLLPRRAEANKMMM